MAAHESARLLLTGHAADPEAGRTERSEITLQPDMLPVDIVYCGRRYRLLGTANQKLLLNGR